MSLGTTASYRGPGWLLLPAPFGDVSSFVGVFGNNWLFFVPTSGPNAGEIFPFAYGPTRCEMTGPTFVGNTLIISVQHPGEDCDYQFTPLTLNRDIEMFDLETARCSRRTRLLC